MWPLSQAALPDNYRLQILVTRSIFADEMYSTTCVKWSVNDYGLVRCKSIHF